MKHPVDNVDLNQIEPLSWALLNEGIESNGPFRFPVLATPTGDGVDARVLVLRHADRASRLLEFHTDRRASKVADIEAFSKACWVFYDPQCKLQLRIQSQGRRVTHKADIDRRWEALSVHTQRAYAQELSPGLEVETLKDAAPCPHVEDPRSGRENFAVVVCEVEEIRWLKLSRSGHQSAVVRFDGSRWSSSWVMP